MTKEQKESLIAAAFQAREKAYVPYSHFAVGAAVLTPQGRIFAGCNIENASYGATVCAERTAIFRAVSEGERSITGIAITGGREGEAPEGFAYPCGICRQVLKEFAGEKLTVLVAKSQREYEAYTLEELLPHGFGGDHLL